MTHIACCCVVNRVLHDRDVSAHCGQVMLDGCFKTPPPHSISPTSFIPPSSSSTPTYNPSFLMRHLTKTPHHSWQKKKKKRAWRCNYTPSPPPSSLRPPIHPKKRAKDVERWIISPRYNLTVTLRCHLLRRRALLMSPTLHVSHFPAN